MTSEQKRVPIAEARNLGEVSAAEMEIIGIKYLDQLIEMGWEEVCIKYCEHFPHRINLNAFTAIIGAIEGQDWRRVDPSLKAEAKSLIRRIKAGTY